MNQQLQGHYQRLSVVIILTCVLSIVSITKAQDDTSDGTPIEISGIVSQIGDGSIHVAGLPVDITTATFDETLIEGATVTVTGHMSSSNVIVAEVIVIINPGVEVTPEVTPVATLEITPTPDSDVIIIIEGPIINIVTNVITIYDFDIELEPAHPILNIVEIGDLIHVEGNFGSSGLIVATIVSNVSSTTIVSTGATASIEGPIEAINGNIVIVNGIPVQFAPNDPQLATLQVGNFLSVQGNFENNGTSIVLVIVQVTVINNIVIDGNPYCWYHDGMGMGHWHCDGMGMGGMGMGGMGMGGMGMGG